jgi:hypothetical protein
MDPILCAAVAVLAVVMVGTAKRDRDVFRARFPPMSDAEFLARCPPGTSPAVALKVRRMVAEHFAVAYERVHPSTGFIDDLGAD